MKHCPIVCGQSKEGVKTQKRNPPTRLPTHGTQRRPFRGLLSPRDIPWEQESRTWRSVLKFSRQIGQAPDESPLRSDANRTSDHSPDHVAWLGEGRSRRGDYDQPNPRRSAATTTHSDAPQSCTPPHPTHTTHTRTSKPSESGFCGASTRPMRSAIDSDACQVARWVSPSSLDSSSTSNRWRSRPRSPCVVYFVVKNPCQVHNRNDGSW